MLQFIGVFIFSFSYVVMVVLCTVITLWIWNVPINMYIPRNLSYIFAVFSSALQQKCPAWLNVSLIVLSILFSRSQSSTWPGMACQNIQDIKLILGECSYTLWLVYQMRLRFKKKKKKIHRSYLHYDSKLCCSYFLLKLTTLMIIIHVT